ncbi:bifunctional adenosylcobinamide kinase/adenosylcobinamide-phosphate guanylyltransferase [Kineothrix sp. MB12-C1]|uniref:bifunctional adenosylcobinamide kinase/adenosylcobinamide-phosphate guanylyltransferase n=1 Tax=Kineothrix sp. MB12-C1 TaxID=3070215 RepID=UPI0027D2E5D2|nr:bifunctional adenosylcobinamide kinase/adenosylcobinamide-phosphate guanylyltransferase [Kineothrix sp. MB12-C1]WMC93310.1 bifunctional adenosylcobinamide kinase/adenosylcobinamide-phosphate guanylyltransferase [Kineothrix sp. MB12-C1]
MVIVIFGGSGSGKSAYAEQKILSLAETVPVYYLATMQVYDEEGRNKVYRHRRQREGRGFLTIEQPMDIGEVTNQIEKSSAILLECMSNLIANEMFTKGEGREGDITQIEQRIVSGIEQLAAAAKHLVIVTNNVFEDGGGYDEMTIQYMELLGRVNGRISGIADQVIEVVVGIPIRVK